jgi:hypothetical protein
LIKDLKKIYGEITIHVGDEHDYLGIMMKYDRNQKKVQIYMEKYIAGCLEEFKEDVPWNYIQDGVYTSIRTLISSSRVRSN